MSKNNTVAIYPIRISEDDMNLIQELRLLLKNKLNLSKIPTDAETIRLSVRHSHKDLSKG